MYNSFLPDLDSGKLLEALIRRNFEHRQIPYRQMDGKSDYDFLVGNIFLEAKFDLLSGFTGRATFEDALLNRQWTHLWLTTLMHKIYTREEVSQIITNTYERKRVKMGDNDQWGTLIPLKCLKDKGLYEGQFAKQLTPTN